MLLVTNNHPNLDLSKQHGVIDVWCAYLSSKKINIHLSCNEGDEQSVIDNLPKWVSDEMKVTRSHTHVILESNKEV